MSTKPSRILVTGGTGYLGAHIVDLLLERGITVVVTARSESKAKDFAERRSRFKDLLEVVITGDLAAVGAFDNLAKNVDVIIHCASPLPSESSPGSTPSKTIIEPAIAGTLSILQAARKNPALKRLVLTSSTTAVVDAAKQGLSESHEDHYTGEDWNSITYGEGTKTNVPIVAYRVGKKYAELEAWAAVDPTSGHVQHLELDKTYPRHANSATPSTPQDATTFDMTVICPPLIFGPWVHPLGPSGLASLNDSICGFRNFVRGDYRSSLPNTWFHHWVDVRDVALAHVEAALRLDRSEHPSISNGRYLVSSPEKFNWHMVAEIMREEFPEWAEEVLPPRGEAPPFPNMSLDGTPATRDLGVKYRNFRECVVGIFRQLRAEVPARGAEENQPSGGK